MSREAKATMRTLKAGKCSKYHCGIEVETKIRNPKFACTQSVTSAAARACAQRIRVRPRESPGVQGEIRNRKGFTLIELAVVIAILGIMIALVAPRMGELGEANLKRSARHLTGMIRFLHDEAQAKKTEYRLTFDVPGGHYWAETWVYTDDVAGSGDKPAFRTRELKRYQSAIAGEGSLSGETKFRDIVVASHPDDAYMLFTPDGWVEHALIHLRDGSDRDFTLVVKPLTGATELREGYVEER